MINYLPLHHSQTQRTIKTEKFMLQMQAKIVRKNFKDKNFKFLQARIFVNVLFIYLFPLSFHHLDLHTCKMNVKILF